MRQDGADKIDGILQLIQDLDDDDYEELCSRGSRILNRRVRDLKEGELATSAKASKRDRNGSCAQQCPHCSGELVKPAGFYRGRRRFRCLTCGRRFNELTGSPITGTHYPEKWRDFMECMVSGLSVAKTAHRIGVTVPTAFAWRHKLLKRYERQADTHLRGIVEADETFFLFSEKGSRAVSKHRKPRKRGRTFSPVINFGPILLNSAILITASARSFRDSKRGSFPLSLHQRRGRISSYSPVTSIFPKARPNFRSRYLRELRCQRSKIYLVPLVISSA